MHKEQEHIEEAERKEGEKGLYEMALNPSLELSLLTEEDQLLTMLGMHPQERVTLLYPMDKKLQFSILSGLPSCTCTRKKHCAGDIAYTLVAMNKKPKHFRDIFQMFELKVQLKILLCILTLTLTLIEGTIKDPLVYPTRETKTSYTRAFDRDFSSRALFKHDY